MKALDLWKNDAEPVLEDESLVLTKKALEKALSLVEKKMGQPMTEAQRKKAEQKAKEKQIQRAIGGILTVAAIGGAAAALVQYGQEKKAEEAEQKMQEQKELYRKLAARKGRL
ncbi:MAG: hypothetical protein HUJ55_00875 [Ileibacterium sp.]|nr:hypothetical protein [Ileibacterium sp.]